MVEDLLCKIATEKCYWQINQWASGFSRGLRPLLLDSPSSLSYAVNNTGLRGPSVRQPSQAEEVPLFLKCRLSGANVSSILFYPLYRQEKAQQFPQPHPQLWSIQIKRGDRNFNHENFWSPIASALLASSHPFPQHRTVRCAFQLTWDQVLKAQCLPITFTKAGPETREWKQPSCQACVITGERRNSEGGKAEFWGLCVPVGPVGGWLSMLTLVWWLGTHPLSAVHTKGFSLMQ